MKWIQLLVFSLLLLCSISLAQRGLAVITLVIPPPSGDGYSELQAGGAFPTGATSLYYNPALLSEIAKSTGSQYHFTQSNQILLPQIDDPNLKQEFYGFSAIAPDPKHGFDLGVGYFRNKVDFGNTLNYR